MLEAESLFESATALSIASLVGKDGGLMDLSDPSSRGMVGVIDLVCRSLSVESVRCVRAEDGRMSSLWGRPVRIPDQSPDTGRVFVNSGEPDMGVREPGIG